MLSAHQYFQGFVQKLSAVYDGDEAKAITNYITSEVLMIKYHQLGVIDKEFNEGDVVYFDRILSRLLTHEPVQYILGYTWFSGIRFRVDNNVLIPRPETEELVEMVIEHCRENTLHQPSIIDFGTGSGCIPISIKKNIPKAVVFGVDVMEGALNVALENARSNHTEITFLHDDMLNPSKDYASEKFDIIISNPPYIDVAEEKDMENNVKHFEPEVALFSPGDALKFYKAIKNIADTALKTGGSIWLEINPLYAEETRSIFNDAQTWLLNDMSGKTRFLKVVKK